MINIFKYFQNCVSQTKLWFFWQRKGRRFTSQLKMMHLDHFQFGFLALNRGLSLEHVESSLQPCLYISAAEGNTDDLTQMLINFLLCWWQSNMNVFSLDNSAWGKNLNAKCYVWYLSDLSASILRSSNSKNQLRWTRNDEVKHRPTTKIFTKLHPIDQWQTLLPFG